MLKVYKHKKHHSTNPELDAIPNSWLTHWEPLRDHTTIQELLSILKPYEECIPLNRKMKLQEFANILLEIWTRKCKITAKMNEYGDLSVSILPEKEIIALQMLMAEHKTIVRTL